jgi:hypothetical protein
MPMTKPTSEQVTFLAAGSGATQRTALDKLRDVVSVKDFGAVGDGVANDRLAIQAALDAVGSAGGGSLYFPSGTYFIDNAPGPANGLLVRHSNMTLFGDGESSKLKQASDVRLLVTLDGRLAQRTNINIFQMCFDGPTTRIPYGPSGPYPQEHYHTLIIVNCAMVRVMNCSFLGFNGDGIDVDAAVREEASPPYPTLRRNSNIWIENNLFDGIDNENRQGVSVITGTNVFIRNNVFRNCTSPYMPGSVDIESNAHPYYVLNNIVVDGNSFRDTLGFVGHVGIVLPANSNASGLPFGKFRITNNTFSGTGRGIGIINGNDIDLDVQITGNVYEGTASPMILGYSSSANYIRGFDISNNTMRWAGANNPPIIGIKSSTAEDVVRDVVISNNIFDGTTQLSGGVHVGGTNQRINITGNMFRNSLDYGLRIGASLSGTVATVSEVSITSNVFTAIAGAGVSVLSNLTPNPNAATCVYANNQSPSGTNGCRFPSAKFVDYSSASPSSGIHAVGALSINSVPAIGQPKGWRCTVNGSPGTWVSEGNL